MTIKKSTKELLVMCSVAVLVLAALFYKSFMPGYVVFSNDGPVGTVLSEQNQVPYATYSTWQDLNYLGSEVPPVGWHVSGGFRILCNYPLQAFMFLVTVCVFSYFYTLKKVTGVICFLWAGIVITSMIVGLDYEILQILCGVSLFIFLFAVIIVFSNTTYDYVSKSKNTV